MRKRGFTLIEMAVVLGIIGFLAVLVIVNYHNYYVKQLTLTTAQSIRSDVDFSVQHAVTGGISKGITFKTSTGMLQVVDQTGTVRSTAIPASVQVAVSGFSSGNPAQGATADVVPDGYWLGFLPGGETVAGQPALIVVATDAVWYAVAINGTGQVSGPTNKRNEIALTDQQLSALLSGNQSPSNAYKLGPGGVPQNSTTIPSGLASQIKSYWKIP